MKTPIFFSVFLLLSIFATGTVMAKAAHPAGNNTETDTTIVITSLEAYPNPTTGMLAIKTECAGRIYFYSRKGKEKGECVVSEGTSMIDLKNLLFPGTYTCRFEGINGSIAEAKVVYKL